MQTRIYLRKSKKIMKVKSIFLEYTCYTISVQEIYIFPTLRDKGDRMLLHGVNTCFLSKNPKLLYRSPTCIHRERSLLLDVKKQLMNGINCFFYYVMLYFNYRMKGVLYGS